MEVVWQAKQLFTLEWKNKIDLESNGDTGDRVISVDGPVYEQFSGDYPPESPECGDIAISP